MGCAHRADKVERHLTSKVKAKNAIEVPSPGLQVMPVTGMEKVKVDSTVPNHSPVSDLNPVPRRAPLTRVI